MDLTFDGDNKLIILGNGVTTLPVRDLYSEWKLWMISGDNAKYDPAFNVVGGDPTIGSNVITPYFFIVNDWRIRPQEANHTLAVDGILIPEQGKEAFADTLGVFRVNIQSIVPIYTETVVMGSGLSEEEREWVQQTNNNSKLIPAILSD